MKARLRERRGLILTGLLLLIVFEALPWLDVWVAMQFYAGEGVFPSSDLSWVKASYLATPWVGRLLFLGTALMLILAGCRLWAFPRWQRRRAVALHLVLLLGLGLVVHAGFKEHWGRPRPHQVQLFAGAHAYVPALRPGGACDSNCSFVSGHAATGFAVLALGLFSARSARRRWFVVAACSGLLIGMGRMLQGSHFLSDILFAGWLMWAVTVVVREGWLRAALWGLRRRRLRQSQFSPAGFIGRSG